MAIILHLDAMEGSLPEVRSQRKEATKMAINLQDAVDAIMMQKDEIVALNSTENPVSEGGTNDNDVLCEESKEVLCPDANTEGHAAYEEGMEDVDAMDDDCTPPEVDVSNKRMPSIDNEMDMLDENVSTPGADHLVQQRESGVSGCVESVADAKPVGTMYDAEQYISIVTGESVAAEEEVCDGIDALHPERHKEHMQENFLVAAGDHDPSVRDTILASRDSAKAGVSNGSCTCMDVVEEVEAGLNQDVEFCPGTPTVKVECDDPHFSNTEHQSQLQAVSTPLVALAEHNCFSDRGNCLPPHQQGCKVCCDGAHENGRNEGVNVTSSSPPEVETQLLPDSVLLQQLSEDCRQLKSLVGKLLVQNKAQSKVLCALGERLQLLEHQQHIDRQRKQQKMLRTMKSKKKGPKRTIKFRDLE